MGRYGMEEKSLDEWTRAFSADFYHFYNNQPTGEREI